MGVRNARIARMVVVQVLVVGVLGYGIGAGLAALSGSILDGAGLAFRSGCRKQPPLKLMWHHHE
jgi:hypothetical protein